MIRGLDSGIAMRRSVVAVLMLFSLCTPALAAGAIALGADGATGYAHDFPSKQAARDAALKNCKGKCDIVLEFAKACGAVATDAAAARGAKGWATGPKAEVAQDAAVKQCAKHGGKQCTMRVSACDRRG